MDISNLTLRQLKAIVRNSYESRIGNGRTVPKHLAITYRWLMAETDEDVFEVLKKGPARDYIAKLVLTGGGDEEDSARDTKEERSFTKRPRRVQEVQGER